MKLYELTRFCHDYLAVDAFTDYCPNGLQVEGKSNVNRLVTGVSANLDLIDAAIAVEADAILVHHGYFWKGEAQPLVGYKAERIRRLMQHDISLIAYHLPLDAHLTVGNNAQLAMQMGWVVTGQDELLWLGELRQVSSIDQLTDDLGETIDSNPFLIYGGDHDVQRLAWCTGAAQSAIEKAAEHGADVFVSGEISEQTVHLAKELGIHFIAAGHHATERYGVQALGELLANRFNIQHQFIDIENPV
ncbi:MAG: Nif3-like dinuclear metal center hexameric protein [Gammaproteobacteria bacterium]|nr:Nif3-like dinuclear metal center hexameric protein [Gammaproteobacteria bacterium]